MLIFPLYFLNLNCNAISVQFSSPCVELACMDLDITSMLLIYQWRSVS
uniref:Uncharacterized protein n=1 Tax=Arundo donax TaxID=35708 RepID=A0A0A9CS41_ARUDO